MRYGLLSQADLERAVAIVLSERKRLGVVLVRARAAGRDRVEEAVGLHAREILFNALEPAGGVAMSSRRSRTRCSRPTPSARYSTGQLILEATRRVHDPEMVRTVPWAT